MSLLKESVRQLCWNWTGEARGEAGSRSGDCSNPGERRCFKLGEEAVQVWIVLRESQQNWMEEEVT